MKKMTIGPSESTVAYFTIPTRSLSTGGSNIAATTHQARVATSETYTSGSRTIIIATATSPIP